MVVVGKFAIFLSSVERDWSEIDDTAIGMGVVVSRVFETHVITLLSKINRKRR